MNTVDAVRAKLAAGQHADSLWVNAERQVELRFEDGEVIILPDAAAGSREFNERLDSDYRTAVDSLARLVVQCGWEDNRKDARLFLSEYVFVPGQPTRIYPF